MPVSLWDYVTLHCSALHYHTLIKVYIAYPVFISDLPILQRVDVVGVFIFDGVKTVKKKRAVCPRDFRM